MAISIEEAIAEAIVEIEAKDWAAQWERPKEK